MKRFALTAAAAACLVIGCAPVRPPLESGAAVSRVRFDNGFGISFADSFPHLDLIQNGRGPDGASYEVIYGETRLLYVIQGTALGFPLGSGGTVRRRSSNPVAVRIVEGRIREYRLRRHLDGRQDVYVQIIIVPSDRPDRDLAERIAASIRVD